MNKIINITILSFFTLLIFIGNSYANQAIKNEIQLLKMNILSKQLTNYPSRDISTLENYLRTLPSLNSDEMSFLQEVLDVMKKYLGTELNIKMETIGDIDGDGEKDLIRSHIFEKNGGIVIKSIWKKNQKIMWKYTLENPYMYVGPSDLFQYDTRGIWVIFTIAVNYAVPKLRDQFHRGVARNSILLQGVEELKRIGIESTQREYLDYLDKFKGLLLQYGEPELGGGLIDIWYRPANKFIPYYRQ